MPGTGPPEETYSAWTIVNAVFDHLVDVGLHPTLGGGGDPGEPAAALLRALGVVPTAEGDARTRRDLDGQLAELRAAMLPEAPGTGE